MNIYFSDLVAGFQETLALHKEGNNIFDMGNHEMFPNISSQQKWRYAKHDKDIHLSNGQNVYSFNAPEGENPEHEFPLQRTSSKSIHDFDQNATAKGLAQVHRADPGHIYFTLQEGKDNPTYTFRHVTADKWKGIPKAKKKKNVVDGVIPAVPEHAVAPHIPAQHPTEQQPPTDPASAMLPNVDPNAIKMAFIESLSKEGSVLDFGNNLMHGGLSPGTDPIMAGAAGAAGGLGYHFLKKNSTILT